MSARLAAAGLIAVGLAVASAGSPGGQARAGTAGAPAGAGVTAPATVTLPTGDNIAVTYDGGRQEASLLPGSPDRQFAEFNLGADLYVVPEAALHSGTPDLAQFDVTRLAAHLPAAPAQPPAGNGQFKLHTLTVNGIDDTGQPDQGDGALVLNLTDTRLFNLSEPFFQGQFKVSVPEGDYAVLSFFFDQQLGTVRLVVLPQVTVTADDTVTLDARTATAPITVAMPQPANSVEEAVTVDRAASQNGSDEYTFLNFTQQQLTWYAAPTSPVSEGALHYYVYDRLYSPAGVTPAYSYALEFPAADGAIPADQAYTVTPDQLAVQDTSYYAAGQDQETLETRFSFLPWESFNFRASSDFTRPLQRTEYYTGSPNITWQSQLFAHADPVTHFVGDQFLDTDHRYTSGQHTTVSWLAGPLHQGTEFDQQAGGFACPACREPGKLNFFIWPIGDNDLGHVAFQQFGQFNDTVSYALSSGGQQIASGNGMLAGTFAVPNKTATYVLTYDVARTEPWWTQSTSIHTQWTFLSSTGVGGPPPPGWTCLDSGSNCTPLPLLTAGYQLPVNLLGQEQPGAVSFGLRIGHFQDSVGAAVTGATAALSFDGGATWTDATVTGQAGDYTVSYSNPQAAATDGFAAIRITAQDAGGGEFTQTVLNAYAIAP